MKKILTFLAIIAVFASSANAALTMGQIDTSDFELVATTILTATAVFFGIRKAISLLY